MYGGGGYDYGRGAGGAFPRRSYPPTAQDEPPYFHQHQQAANFGPGSGGNWGPPPQQQQIQQRQAVAAAGGPSPRLEGLLGELRDLVAQKGRLSPTSVNMINRATEAVAAQRRSGGFQSPYHLQQAERSIEAIRQATEQRMAERQRQQEQQQAIYQHRDSGSLVSGLLQQQSSAAPSWISMRPVVDYQRSDMMYRGSPQPSAVGPMFNASIQEEEPAVYQPFQYGGGGRGSRAEVRGGRFPARGRGGSSNDRPRGFRGRAAAGGIRGGGRDEGFGVTKRSFPYHHQKQEEVVRKKPLFSAERGKDQGGRGNLRGGRGSPRGGRGTAIAGSWAKESKVSSSPPKNKSQQSQVAKKKDVTAAGTSSGGAVHISCPLCDEICKDEAEFKAHVLKGHDDKPKQNVAAEKEVIDVEKESAAAKKSNKSKLDEAFHPIAELEQIKELLEKDENYKNQYEAKLKELKGMPVTWADKSETVPQEEFQKLGKQALEVFVKLYDCEECHAHEYSLFDIGVHWNTEKHRISPVQLAEYELFQRVGDSIKLRVKNAPKQRKEEASQLIRSKPQQITRSWFCKECKINVAEPQKTSHQKLARCTESYTCPFCNRKYGGLWLMKWHFWRDHIGIKNAEGNFICPYRCKKNWSTASVDGFAAHMRRLHPVTKLDGAIVLERAQAVDVQCDFCEQKESVLATGQRYGAPIIQHETKMHADKIRNPAICKFCGEDTGGNVAFLCRHVRVFHSRTGNEFLCNVVGCDLQAPTYENLISHCKKEHGLNTFYQFELHKCEENCGELHTRWVDFRTCHYRHKLGGWRFECFGCKAIIEGSPENFHYHKAFDCKQRDVFPPNCKDEPSVKQQADADDAAAAAQQSKSRKQVGEEEFKVVDEVGGDEEVQITSEVDNKLTDDGDDSQDEDLSSIKLDTSVETEPEAKLINGNGDSAALPEADDMWEQEFAEGANNQTG